MVDPEFLGITFDFMRNLQTSAFENWSVRAMSRTIPRRLLAQAPLNFTAESTSSIRLPLRCIRPFSKTSSRDADDTSFLDRLSPSPAPAKRSTSGGLGGLGNLFRGNAAERAKMPGRRTTTYDPDNTSSIGNFNPTPLSYTDYANEPDPFRLSVYATRHNTHINVMGPDYEKDTLDPKTGKPPLKVWISMSAGNIGFKKSQRKHYDAAFQLASYVFARMKERGINDHVGKLEVQLRGFGSGREAVTKALLGSEGRFLRQKVVKVSDATRLKFGGTRSKKPRRLG